MVFSAAVAAVPGVSNGACAILHAGGVTETPMLLESVCPAAEAFTRAQLFALACTLLLPFTPAHPLLTLLELPRPFCAGVASGKPLCALKVAFHCSRPLGTHHY
jgi:hypothetical protein